METRECAQLASTSEASMAEVRVGDRSMVTKGCSVPGAAMMASCARFARQVK